jgi:hypothetical protein
MKDDRELIKLASSHFLEAIAEKLQRSPAAVRQQAVRLGLSIKRKGKGEMTDDPNEAYQVVSREPGAHGPPEGWWTVKRNGVPLRHFPGRDKAERYAIDPEYRASLRTGKAWEEAKGGPR